MTVSQITRCGVAVALLAVSAAISLPVGPVPFTLQTLVVVLLPIALGGGDAVRSVAVYLLMGALGLPVFSGFTGGVDHLLGPTGGFLWGFLLGMCAAAALLRIQPLPERARETLAAAVLLVIPYATGTLQLMTLLGVSMPAALATAVAPFLIPDLIKAAVGLSVGRSVRGALSSSRTGSFSAR